MPNAPVPVAQAIEWILQNVAASLEDASARMSSKEEKSLGVSDLDAFTSDSSTSPGRVESNTYRNAGYSRNQTFVEGISKACVSKYPSDIKGNSVKVRCFGSKASKI